MCPISPAPRPPFLPPSSYGRKARHCGLRRLRQRGAVGLPVCSARRRKMTPIFWPPPPGEWPLVVPTPPAGEHGGRAGCSRLPSCGPGPEVFRVGPLLDTGSSGRAAGRLPQPSPQSSGAAELSSLSVQRVCCSFRCVTACCSVLPSRAANCVPSPSRYRCPVAPLLSKWLISERSPGPISVVLSLQTLPRSWADVLLSHYRSRKV